MLYTASMSKLVAVRIPDYLAVAIKATGKTQSQIIIAALAAFLSPEQIVNGYMAKKT